MLGPKLRRQVRRQGGVEAHQRGGESFASNALHKHSQGDQKPQRSQRGSASTRKYAHAFLAEGNVSLLLPNPAGTLSLPVQIWGPMLHRTRVHGLLPGRGKVLVRLEEEGLGWEREDPGSF